MAGRQKFSAHRQWSLRSTLGDPGDLSLRMRRADCPDCGVKVEWLPWADGKHRSTYSYRIFLASWAKRLSWKETAAIFGTSWDSAYRAIDWVVRWGLLYRETGEIEAIRVGEIISRADALQRPGETSAKPASPRSSRKYEVGDDSNGTLGKIVERLTF